METNGASEVTTLCNDVAEDSETTVEIKIKTLDSRTYTLRVNKCVPIPALKEQIATVTGVVSQQQRLICRGRVLKDDELLSAYHIEDGHTLHLVVRQPHDSSSSPSTGHLGSEGTSSHSAANPSSSIARNLGNRVARSFVIEAVNIDQGDHGQHLNQLLSNLLNSIGTTNSGSQNPRTDHREMGARASGDTGLLDSSLPHPNPAASRVGPGSRQAAPHLRSSVRLGSQQPNVIPDSLTTINQYLGFMRDEFRREGFSADGMEQNGDVEVGSMHMQNHESQSYQHSQQGGLPSPASLIEIALSTRQLLMEQAERCLSQLAGRLEDHVSMTDPLMRMNVQSSTMRSGVLLQNLGSLLLELGRTTMTLRMGQTPLEAVINAGPAVFISATGPNPVMVQPVPFYPGSNFGALPMGSVSGHSGHGPQGDTLGSAFVPRNIDIRIHTVGRPVPVGTGNLAEQAGTQQPQEQIDPSRNSSGATTVHQAYSGASGGTSFTGETGVRVVPIRTVVAVPAGVDRSPSDSSGSALGLIYPLLARVQQVNTGNVSDSRGSHASSEPYQGGTSINQQPNLESVMQRQESSNEGVVRDGNHFPANTVPVPFGMSDTAGREGSSQAFITSLLGPTTENNSQANVRQETGQGPVAQILNRVDQWLRTIFPGEQVQAGGINHESVTVSAADQIGTAGNAETQEASRVGNNEGVFLSSLVRQLMPFISQGTAPEPGGSSTNHNSSPGQAARENLDESSSSQHPRDQPEAPSPKRLKRDDE